jgi:hypothetical protein
MALWECLDCGTLYAPGLAACPFDDSLNYEEFDGGEVDSARPLMVGNANLSDGSDRTADLQALLDSVPSSGGRVVLPAGHIRTTATVQLSVENTTLEGAGRGSRVGSSQGGLGTQIGPNDDDTFDGTDILLVQMVANTRPLHGAVLRDLQIEGNDVAGLTGIHWRSNRSRIENVGVTQCASHGIRLHGYLSPAWDLYDSTIQAIVSHCGGSALWFDDGATDVHVLPGTVLHDCNKGLHFTGGGSAQVTGVHTYDNTLYNFHFDAAGSRTKISNCKIEGAGQHGIMIDSTTTGYSDIQIEGNNLANNGDSANNTYDHIHVTGVSQNGITRTNIGHNSFTNKGSNTNLARYGVNFNNSAVQTALVVGNSFGPSSHFGTGPLRDNGAGGSVRVIRHNGGYVTEAGGTATVANGATTVVVTHGVAATPSAQHVSVTPTNSMGNAAEFFISSVGATTFTINVNTDPGATTATFAWRIAVVQ